VLQLSLGNTDSIAYDHTPPSTANGVTFVFFNALTGDKSMWNGAIGERLLAAGHGLLAWNLRGQADSAFSIDTFTQKQIADDALALLEEVQPQRPVHVGLSIGGLFAGDVHLAGSTGRAEALVFINTLRKIGPRIAWINDALPVIAKLGGGDLVRDLYGPLLFNEEWQRQNREQFLKGGYLPLEEDTGTFKLMACGSTMDWDIPYEKLDVPVLNITGLQDRVFLDLDDVGELLARLPQVRDERIADAGHLIPAERPEEFAELLVDFAASLKSAR